MNEAFCFRCRDKAERPKAVCRIKITGKADGLLYSTMIPVCQECVDREKESAPETFIDYKYV